MSTNRRTFLAQAGATIAAAGGLAGSPPSAPAQTAPRALDATLLAAIGDAVLPESLGAAGRSRAVRAFSAWIAAYHPVAEEMHGYGDAEITYTPADPAPGWNAQLEGLELLARRKHHRGFAALDVQARRALLKPQLAQLSRQRGDRLPPNPLAAPHVAIALLAHWADSSEATDLAYGVRIGKGECRLLADSPRKPLPLAPPGRG
jgi:hypothetical protein